jgi:hypothetical protein
LADKAVQATLAMTTATATYIFYNIIPAAAAAAVATAAATTTTTSSSSTSTKTLPKLIAIVFDKKPVDVFTHVRFFNFFSLIFEFKLFRVMNVFG